MSISSNRIMRRFLWFTAVCVALYAVVGFFVLPPILKTQLERRGAVELGRSVSIQRVRVNPFVLSATFDGVEVGGRGGTGAPLLGWQRLLVNFDPLSSITRDWTFGEIVLAGFHGVVEIGADGKFNFSDLIEKFQPSSEPQPPSKLSRPIRIDRLNVANARVDFSDRSRGDVFHTEVGPVNLTLLQFRTAGSRGAPYRFEAESEAGEKVHWTGTLAMSPLASAGEWRIENLSLPKYAPYFQDRLNATIASGRLTASAQYEASFAPGRRSVVVKGGAVELNDFRLLERGGSAPLVEISSGQVTGIEADALASRVAIDVLRLDKGRLALHRETDGSLNLLKVLATGGATSPAPSSKPEKPLELTAKEISLRDFDIELRDRSPSPPVQLDLSRANANVKNFTLAIGAPIPFDVTFGIAPQGTAHIAGNATIDPLQADFTVEFAWLPLAPFSGYLNEMADARLARGIASMKGHVIVSLAPGAPLNATFAGDGRIEDLALVEARSGDELAGLSEFALQDLKIATAPRLTLSLGELRLGGPYAHAVITAEQGLNFASLMRQKPTQAEQPAAVSLPETTSGAAPEITVTRVVVQGGEVTFVDHSVQPQAELSVRQIGGMLRNLSSLHPELGEAQLQASVNGSGPLSITGRVSPLAKTPSVDLKVDLDSVDLAPISPYIGKYAGFELERGRLFLDTQAKLEQEKLDSQNTITLEQFTLGRATQSADAVKLPVKLGVALLKDAQGRIRLDVPVQGSLADPQFQVGQVVSHAFTSLLSKAATSPFALLGSMFGGGGEELAQQEFEPGTATLTAESLKRLATVQRALTERPALNLEIVGGYDQAADAPALKRAKLDDVVKKRIWEERKARDPNVPPVEQLTVDEREREVIVRRLFAEMPGAQMSAVDPNAAGMRPVATGASRPLPPAPEPETARSAPPEKPAEERHGFLRRTFDRTLDIATLKGWRERRAARKEAEEEQQRAEARQAEAAQQAEEARRAFAAQQQTPANDVAANVPLDVMIAQLTERQTVAPEDLHALANARAQRVREVLMTEGKIAEERLNVTKASDDSAKIGHRVVLHLQ